MDRGKPTQFRTAVGIDVGGKRKGFHAVALNDGQYAARFSTTNVEELVAWCLRVDAAVIAVDAPCRWSTDGRARPSERELMKKGVWCFSTPTRERAVERKRQSKLGMATNHYGWMLRGEKLIKALERTHPLCTAYPPTNPKFCFETFPHAITWHLGGGKANASRKRAERRALLAQAGIDLTELTNIDLIDAALCALTADHLACSKECVQYGEQNTGLIIVPAALNHEREGSQTSGEPLPAEAVTGGGG